MCRKGNPLTVLVGMQTGTAAVENSMEVPQKVKNRTTLQSSNYTTGYLFKEYKNTKLKGYIYPCVYSSIIYNSQIMEAVQVSIERWMDKDVVYINNLQRSTPKKQIIQLINGQKTWTDISPKKKSRWPADTWKEVHRHLPSGKCKSKLQWDITYICQNS